MTFLIEWKRNIVLLMAMELKTKAPLDISLDNTGSTKDMFKLYDLTKGNLLPIDNTESGSCSESCELYPMEET